MKLILESIDLKNRWILFWSGVIVGFPIGFIILVILSGGTFGARCKEAGLTGVAYEQCIYDLSKGHRLETKHE